MVHLVRPTLHSGWTGAIDQPEGYQIPYQSLRQPGQKNSLAGLSQFITSRDFYELVKESEAARKVRNLMPLLPFIVRSSSINEDNYGDAQAGKYLSKVQGD